MEGLKRFQRHSKQERALSRQIYRKKLVGSKKTSYAIKGFVLLVFAVVAALQRIVWYQKDKHVSSSIRQPSSRRNKNVRGGSFMKLGSTKEQPKKTLYFHVGIPKTATTFLQCTLASKLVEKYIKKDGMMFMGTCPSNMCGFDELPQEYLTHKQETFFEKRSANNFPGSYWGPRLHQNVTYSSKNLSPNDVIGGEFEKKLDELLINSSISKALVIFEGAHRWSAESIHAIAEFLLPNWDVQILVAYRRYYEWLPSKYNSVTKTLQKNKWPEGTHKFPIQPFNLTSTHFQFNEYVSYLEETSLHPTDIVAKNYRQYFKDVTILDLHRLPSRTSNLKQTDPYLSHLLCDVLTIPNACRTYNEGLWPRQVSDNPSIPLDADRLAVGAYIAKLLRNKARRSDVRLRIQMKLNKSKNTVPQKCLSEAVLKKIYETSQRMEKNLFGQSHEDHLSGYNQTLGKGTYCSADISAMLHNETWKSYLLNSV